jgi:hypothetical protein
MAGVAFAVDGDGVGFATESYAASALYTTLANLSGAFWRIRRASDIPIAGRALSAEPSGPSGQVLVTHDWIATSEFGAKGDGNTDDTTAIQAAIDAAYASNKGAVRLPAGNYKISSPLSLDAPNNLRNSLNNPTMFNFSMALVGEFAFSNHEGFGSRILTTTDDFVALWGRRRVRYWWSWSVSAQSE